MKGAKRLGLWFCTGLENGLAARAVLGTLQSENPGAEWVLFGPRESLFLFEMDERVCAYVPLLSLAPRRAAQSRLSYFLEKRAQFLKLRALKLDSLFGAAVPPFEPVEKQFSYTLRMLGISGRLIKEERSWFAAQPAPLLQAGPQALAFATQLHRKSPHQLQKCLVLLLAESVQQRAALEADWQAAQNTVNTLPPMHTTVAVVTNHDRLLARQLAQAHPDWIQLDFAQAVGLIAYADRVICMSDTVTRICREMDRFDRVLLGKSNS